MHASDNSPASAYRHATPYSFTTLWLVVLLSFSLTGCLRTIAAVSDEPADSYHGKRTLGSFFEDQAIENKSKINLLRANPHFREAHVVVVSFNGNVLLTGQVENQAMKQKAEAIVANIRHVRKVHNEIKVIGSGSRLARINDGWLTFKTKMRLYLNGQAPGWRTKVVTENGVVYLMGLLTKEESDAVVEQARKVYGVQKIIKIIEYING